MLTRQGPPSRVWSRCYRLRNTRMVRSMTLRIFGVQGSSDAQRVRWRIGLLGVLYRLGGCIGSRSWKFLGWWHDHRVARDTRSQRVYTSPSFMFHLIQSSFSSPQLIQLPDSSFTSSLNPSLSYMFEVSG